MKTFNITTRSFMETVFENLYPHDFSKSRIILGDGNIIYNSNDTEGYNFFDFFEQHCKDSFFGSLTTPYLIWTGVGSITQLEKISYDSVTVDFLNENGLTIYFQEMLLFGFGEKKNLVAKDEWVNSEKDITYKDIDFNFNLDKTNAKNIYSFELESVKKFIEKNNLTNVTVYTCELDTNKTFQSSYPKIRIKSGNVWTTSFDSNHINKNYDSDNDPFHINKHFLSLSLRYELHKHLISAYLISKDAEISWHENCREWDTPTNSFDYLNSQSIFDIEEWRYSNPSIYYIIKNNVDILSEKYPILLNGEKLQSRKNNRIRCGTEHQSPYKNYREAFCNVICETKFGQPFGYFSEKVLNCMTFERPFILVSTPKSLYYLKMYGFKTFDKWWDESYDNEEDHEKRLLQIFELIDKIESWPLKQCRDICNDMKKVLVYNKEHIKNIRYNLDPLKEIL